MYWVSWRSEHQSSRGVAVPTSSRSVTAMAASAVARTAGSSAASATWPSLWPSGTERTAAEIFRIASEVRAPFSRILEPRELYEWPHLAEIGFWQHVDHPRLGRHPLPSGPVQLDGIEPGSYRGTNRRAPLVGEHTDEVLDTPRAQRRTPTPASTGTPALPFAGLRVVDVSQVWAGPYATRLLAARYGKLPAARSLAPAIGTRRR